MSTEPAPVLLVDDDTELGAMLVEYLARFSLAGEHHADVNAGIEAARTGTHQAIVLDVMMPGIDGFEACRRIREFSGVPIIMLTARGETADKVVGLEAGADDYLAKPFEPRELAARLQALLRRSAGGLAGAEVGRLHLDHRRGRASLRGEDDAAGRTDLGLTDTEFAVLAELVKRRPEPVSRDKLFGLMRGFERDLSDRSIDILISRLRHKLGDDPAAPAFIRTVRLVGYSYVGQ